MKSMKGAVMVRRDRVMVVTAAVVVHRLILSRLTASSKTKRTNRRTSRYCADGFYQVVIGVSRAKA